MDARGTATLAPLAFLLALTVFPSCARADAAQEGRDQVLAGCGICYPDGYDINTAGEVRGTVLDLQVPDEGPVRFVVLGERERWVVLASPAWFWKSAKLRLARGDSVTVRGSKTLGSDGRLYLVAREILAAGDAPVLVLRDRRGAPLWGRGHRGNRVPVSDVGDCRPLVTGRGRNGGAGCR
ncbi:MAG: hypothetical protein ACYC9Y_00060 [Candidatus Methylomirabilia bacterium]